MAEPRLGRSCQETRDTSAVEFGFVLRTPGQASEFIVNLVTTDGETRRPRTAGYCRPDLVENVHFLGSLMQLFQCRDRNPLKFLRLELCKPASVRASLGQAYVVPQPCGQYIKNRCGQGFAGIDAVRNVEVTRTAQVSDKRRRATRHVGGQDGCRIPEVNRPPGPSMTGDVRLVRSQTFSPSKEPLDLTMFFVGELTQIRRQIDHATKCVWVPETGPRIEQLASSGYGGKQYRLRQRTGERPRYPYGIAACDLTTMNTAELTKFNLTARCRASRLQKRRPAPRFLKPGPGNFPTPWKRAEFCERVDRTKPDATSIVAQVETGDHSRCGRVSKRHGRRRNNMQVRAVKAVDKQFAQEVSIVHVEPLG